MATISPGTIDLDGVRLEPVPNAPFSLADFDTMWLVESGKLDVFLSTLQDEEPFGARHHVLRVEAGQAIFGVGSHVAGVGLFAAASPQTSVLCLSHAQMYEMVLGSESDFVLRLLEGWIGQLGAALSKDVAQGPLVNIGPGETVALPEQPKTVVSRHGVVWITHRKGESQFLSDSTLPPVNGRYFFPVAKHVWVKAAPESEIYSIDSRSLMELDPERKSLDRFNFIAMSCLASQIQKAAEKEELRLRALSEADLSRLHSSFLRLSAPIAPMEQISENESTAANALLMACEAIGKRLRINIKAPIELSRGQKLADPVAAIARASNIRVRNIALKGEWWKQESDPLLAFEEQSRTPMALLPRGTSGYDAYIPTQGLTLPVTPELAATLRPFGCVFYRPFPAARLGAWDLLKFGLLGCKKELVAIAVMGVAAGLMAIIIPFATGIVFDSLIPSSDRVQLKQMAGFLVLIAVATSMFAFARGFAALRLEGKLDASIQAAVWDRLLSLPVSFFRDYTSGDLAQRSLGITIIRQTLTGSTLTAILGGIFSVFSFALLFYYSWKLALVATLLVVSAFLVSVACGAIQVRRQRQVSRLNGKISGLLLQFVHGIAKFRVSGTEGRAFSAWAREFSDKKHVAISASRVSNLLIVFNSIFPLVCYAVIFYCYQFIEATSSGNGLTTGQFLAFLAAFTQFLTAALLLSSALVAALSVVPVYERAKPIFHALPEVTEAKADPGQLSGAIEVSNVCFRYKNDTQPVLRDLSIKIEPGQFVAIVGGSGSGKSTLFRLLLGFETPESGAIFYDGHDLAGVNAQAARQQMGVVLQSSRPINGSIFQNIVGSAPLTIEDAWEAARLAGLEEDIKRMPMGMHTHLGDGGGSISGGQRQRLMIARAIVKRPRILLFDEATSALDNHTQLIVMRSLESLQSTRVVIAHRLSTVMKADSIFVLDRGAVAQSGTYEQLMAQTGMFRELAKRQMT
jgi:NHLM bacteriocin system ABC transporter ATP-binding protein